MPYFVDSTNAVMVTAPNSRNLPPAGVRSIDTGIAAQAGLADGQQLTATQAACLVQGDVAGYLATFAPGTAPVIEVAPDPNLLIDAGPPLNTYGLMVVTTPTLPGWSIDAVLGTVIGNTVRTRNALSRMGAGIAASFGGELTAYTTLLSESRNEAVRRMVGQAKLLGATAIIGVAFNTSELLEIATELLVVGTAVTAHRIADQA
jgi:uncharacterized protein YbjQ (UPF0145 family)